MKNIEYRYMYVYFSFVKSEWEITQITVIKKAPKFMYFVIEAWWSLAFSSRNM